MSAIVRIGEFALDLGNPAARAGVKDVTTDRRQIGIEPHDEFARCIDPLPRDRGNQSQQDRLVFEQAAKAASLHLGDKPIVLRRSAISPRLARTGRRYVGLPRLGKALVDCRSGKAAHIP